MEYEYIEKLQNYLIDKKNGYLVRDISKGKVLMLSGAWGSGKTYFWQEKIIKENKNTVYISLYGKSSIKDIENEVLLKAYYLSIGRDNKEKDIVEKFSSTFSIASKTIDTIFGTKIDEIKEEFNNINNNQKNKEAKEFINDGLIICFDDFERKSSSINLQDLFGFITNLSLQYKSRVIIILNSGVFSDIEKEIFTNVKEKSVSKYITFTPTCSELFEIIFDFDKDVKKGLSEHRNILKSTFKKVDIVNARIMKQTLDNILEWIAKNKNSDDKTLELLVLVNINFILNHKVYKVNIKSRNTNEIANAMEQLNSINSDYPTKNYPIEMEQYSEYEVKYSKEISFSRDITKHMNNRYDDDIIKTLKHTIDMEGKENSTKSGKADKSQSLIEYLENNSFYFKSLHFMECFKINEYCEVDKEKVGIFNKINNFIETGML